MPQTEIDKTKIVLKLISNSLQEQLIYHIFIVIYFKKNLF